MLETIFVNNICEILFILDGHDKVSIFLNFLDKVWKHAVSSF